MPTGWARSKAFHRLSDSAGASSWVKEPDSTLQSSKRQQHEGTHENSTDGPDPGRALILVAGACSSNDDDPLARAHFGGDAASVTTGGIVR